MLKILFLLSPIYLAVFLLFYPVLTVYFSQDDFFHFKASLTDGSIASFVKLFGFPSFGERGYGFYRPVSREGFYNLYYSLFGLNVLPFRLFQFFVHFVNITLVYIFIANFFKDKKLAYFVSCFFGLSAVNVGVLYYSAGGIQTSLATLFILLTLIIFKLRVRWSRIVSLVTFVLGLASHEIAAVTPILLTGMLFLERGDLGLKSLIKVTRTVWFFYGLLLIYLYLDVVKIGFQQAEVQYKPVFGLKIFANTLVWYLLWGLGVPEMLVDFVGPGAKLNPSLLKHWGDYFILIFPAFFLAVAVLFFSAAKLVIKKSEVFRNKSFWFFILWFPLTISPVALLPQHKFVHYLAPSILGIATVAGYLLLKTNKRLLSLFVLCMLILNISSIKLAWSTYWAVTRGKSAGRLLRDIKEVYPSLPKGAVVYIKNDLGYPYIAKDWGGTSKQTKFILNNQDALQLAYGDFTLKTFYEDDSNAPTVLKDNTFEFVAKITD